MTVATRGNKADEFGTIISYVEDKTGKKTRYSLTGDVAPYNGTPEYSIDTQKARSIGRIYEDTID